MVDTPDNDLTRWAGVRIKPKLRPDLSLIEDYSDALSASQPHKTPFATRFVKDGRELTYIAAGHESGVLASTHQTIQEAITRYKPDLIVLEGFETSRGISPVPIAQQAMQQQDKWQIDERNYATQLAIKNAIPFLGGEPDNKAIFEGMAAKGYTPKDMASYYALRMVPFWKKQGMDAPAMEQAASRYLSGNSNLDAIPKDQRPTLEEFKAWYAKHAPAGKPLADITANDYAPYNMHDSNTFQRMSYETGNIREAHLDTTIANALNTHNKVLVIYGSGHLMQSRKLFENLLGPSSDVKIR